MDKSTWNKVAAALCSTDVEAAVAAAARLHAEATAEDLPRLLDLLKTGRDFFIREAAAWPLVELAGPAVLREVFAAYQLGFDEGHDNDGFTAALLEIPALHPVETKPALENLVTHEAGATLEHAQWLMEFCR